MRLRANAPWIRALLVFAIFYGLAICYGYFNFYGDPWSVFYNEEKAYEYRYTQYRLDEAEKFISTFESSPYALEKAGPNPVLCAAFIAEVRPGHQYIKNAVSSAIEGLTSEERRNLLIHVQFSHSNPAIHPDWNDPWLGAAVDSVHSYNISNEKFARLRFLESIDEFREKSVLDYTEALQLCFDSGADYIAIFEDDVIFAHGWFAQTLNGLLAVQEKTKDNYPEWVSLRLFDEERALRWEDSDQESWYRMYFSITAVILIASILLRLKSSRARYHLDNTTLILVATVMVPSYILFYIKSGKSSMVGPTSGVHEVGMGCCAEGFVFPKSMVPRVRAYMRNIESGWIDLLINDFTNFPRMDFIRYELYPPQMQHVGMQGVHGTTDESERKSHNAAFERLDPKALQRKHGELVKKLYPE